MGCAPSQPDIAIIVTTGDLKQLSGTDNEVSIILSGKDGRQTEELVLDCLWRNDFRRGRTDVFKFVQIDIGELSHIELKKTGSDDWYCEKIIVKNNLIGGKQDIFPICRWIRTEEPLTVQPYDCELPDDSYGIVGRKRELDSKRTDYQLDVKEEGMPPMAKEVPAAEVFSDKYIIELGKVVLESLVQSGLNLLTSDHWESLDDLKNIYGGWFPKPEAAIVDCSSDRYFGEQRVAGCNPLQLKLCTSLPENFPVTNEMLAPFLEGMILQDALNEKRIFIEDLTFLDGVEVGFPGKFKLCAPMCLFFKNKEDQLLPVAIQLFPTPGPDNPIFLPSDYPNKWTLVKIWFNNADAQLHESTVHLALTHVLMDSFIVSANRQLSPSHPVFRLMAPHFLYTLQINALAVTGLLSEGGLIDELMTMGVKGAYEIIRRYMKDWKFGTQGSVDEDLIIRGVDDPKVLPHYPYRDDSLLLHQAVKKYVTEVLTLFYDTDESIKGDEELQAWAKEISDDVKDGGCGIQGVPGAGKFVNLDEIIAVVTNVIYTSSVGHAAINFNQYDQYGFPAAYPSLLHGEPPRDKNEVTQKEILEQLPTKIETVKMMSLGKILSEKATRSLGDFEIQYMYHPKVVAALKQFRADLSKAEQQMKLAGKNREFPYDVLWPSLIPNAISI